jgi:Tfp pilus assembly protein PilO
MEVLGFNLTLRDAFILGYARNMERPNRLTSSTDAMEAELKQIKSQEREVALNFEVIRAHLKAVRDRREFLEEQINLARQGQLPLDCRPDPGE